MFLELLQIDTTMILEKFYDTSCLLNASVILSTPSNATQAAINSTVKSGEDVP
jgi:hypothetical protein